MIYRKPPARAEIQDGEVPRRLAVVCCFFGFAKYQKPAGNVRRFVRQMAREGVAVYGAEAYVDEPRLPELGWLCVRAGENQILWQKEALLNLAAAQVPEEYNAVAWIDPDVWLPMETGGRRLRTGCAATGRCSFSAMRCGRARTGL